VCKDYVKHVRLALCVMLLSVYLYVHSRYLHNLTILWHRHVVPRVHIDGMLDADTSCCCCAGVDTAHRHSASCL
jgi:hypothetical protein